MGNTGSLGFFGAANPQPFRSHDRFRFELVSAYMPRVGLRKKAYTRPARRLGSKK